MTTNVIPLFLRFLNLLINDSIFLLDEALQVCFFCDNMLFNPFTPKGSPFDE